MKTISLTLIKEDVSKVLIRASKKGERVSNKQEAYKFGDYCEKKWNELFTKYNQFLDNRIQNIEYRFQDFIEDLNYLYSIKDKVCRRVIKI